MIDKYQQRTGYAGDVNKVLRMVCRDFDLGDFITSHVVQIGYEDFNICLETGKGKYFVKIFASFRTDTDCERYSEMIEKAIVVGVQVPPLIRSNQGYLWMKTVDGIKIRLYVMECLDGKDFFSAGTSPSSADIRVIAQQAALINTIDLRPSYVYDAWAIVNFSSEFEKKKQYLDAEDLKLIEPIFNEFSKLDIKALPHCFVHGDIIRTNVVKDSAQKIWVVDFSVANYYPRIQELAVLACDVCFDESSKENSERNFAIALEEYQKKIVLSKQELDKLPLFIKVAHAIHVVCGMYEITAKNNTTGENEYYIQKGRAGLNQMK